MGNMMLNRFQVFTIMTFVAVNEALAQATPPATPGSPAAPAAPATTDDGAPWLWIIIGLALLAAIVWYFMRGRSRTTTTAPTGTSAASGTTTSHPKVYDNDKSK
jgi:bacteriorhodopsin